MQVGRVNLIPRVDSYRVQQKVTLLSEGVTLTTANLDYIFKSLKVTVTTPKGNRKEVTVK